MATYLRRWILMLLGLLLGAVAFNYAVDPYGLYRAPGEGDWKPHAATQADLVKPYLALRHPGSTLILGNSRAEVGLDPRDAAWPDDARPVFNLALPGTGTRVARRLFEHTLAAHPPRQVVLGVDFMDFLVTPDARGGDPAMTRRLLNEASPWPDVRRWLQLAHDGAATLASLDAVAHSLDTLRVRGQAGVAHLTPEGFNPMHDYQRIARQEGYFNLFRQRDLENLRAYQRRPKNLFTRGSRSSPAFEDLTAILDTARGRGIQVRVVIYPYHAHLLEILRLTGMWPLFEEWKRELAQRVASHGRSGAVLWDFSGYHAYAREPVPPPGDRTTVVRWYWEAGHFKKELGHRMIRRLAGEADPDFGVPLGPDNVEAHLAAVSRAGEAYRREHPDVVESLARLAR